MSGTYTCARCGGTFGKGWSDEEAATEAAGSFTAVELEEVAVVCDDCYKEFMPHLPRIRAEMDQEAAALGITLDELLRRG